MEYRINKYLALCGLGSRRKVEELILEGKILINDKKITDLSKKINTDKDIVKYKNKVLNPINKYTYLILNKPVGYVTSMNDEKNRIIVMDLIPEKYRKEGVFPVGRLDKNSEGLLLLTNDGDLANKLNRPEYKIPKEYILELDKPLETKEKKIIERGLFIHQLKLKTRPAKVEVLNDTHHLVKVTLKEGKKRQLRFTFQNLGFKVKKLVRISYGPLNLTGLNKGSHRTLKGKEISQLKSLVKQ